MIEGSIQEEITISQQEGRDSTSIILFDEGVCDSIALVTEPNVRTANGTEMNLKYNTNTYRCAGVPPFDEALDAMESLR